MRYGTGARSLTILLAVILIVLPASSPLWGDDGEGGPYAIGFITDDGQTGLILYDDGAQLSTEPRLGLSYTPGPPDHELVYLTNLERVPRGKAPLKAASELMDAAQFHSDWMADHDCFAHNCPGEPDWVTRIENAGYTTWEELGENIAGGYTQASAVVTAFMNSPSHRDNMLNETFREAGGGYAYSGSSTYGHYWTLDFGRRTDVYPVIINNEAWSTSSLQVNLYVHGDAWPASQMRFRNAGGTWSAWQAFSNNKSWTLSCSQGSPATVYAQIRQGAVVLTHSDQIVVESALSAQPTHLVFLSEEGASPTIPSSYQVGVSTCDSWNASANQSWVKLNPSSGAGNGAMTAYLEGFPTSPGIYQATITVETQSPPQQAQVQVILVVTSGTLEHNYVPYLLKN